MIKPMLKYQEPKYPTRLFFVKHPELLSRYSPKEWKANRLISTLLLSFALNGQEPKEQQMDQEIIKKQIVDREDGICEIIEKQKGDFELKIPLFVHGDGYGGGGCMSIAPSVYLSEDDAIDLITKEFAKEGITLQKAPLDSDVEIDRFVIDRKTIFLKSIQNGVKKPLAEIEDRKIAKSHVALNLYNEEYNLAAIFISIDLALHLDPKNTFRHSSVWGADALEIASLVKKSADNSQYNIAVFYEPGSDPKSLLDDYLSRRISQSTYIKSLIESDKKLLKSQIEDFLEWFKHQIQLQQR